MTTKMVCENCGRTVASGGRDLYAALTRRGGPNPPHQLRSAAHHAASTLCVEHLSEQAFALLQSGRRRVECASYLALDAVAPDAARKVDAAYAAHLRAGEASYCRAVLARSVPGGALYKVYAAKLAALEADGTR